jgi:hypothetical protein
MKLLVENSPLHSYTIQHLLGWIEALSVLINTEDWPFSNAEELALQLEVWREEYQRINQGIVAHEPVLVMLYGEKVILIANQSTGEYILFTYQSEALCLEEI